MEDRPAALLIRRLHEASSRRTALGVALAGLPGFLGLIDATAKRKRHKPTKRCSHCGQCRHCVRGRCQAVANGAGCRNGGICEAGACVGFAGCPPGCPVCAACTSPAGLCETQPNGQAGNQCETPKVCCSGECCDPIHQCNADGACATCAEVCSSRCPICLSTTTGQTFCAVEGSTRCTGQACRLASDCGVDAPFASACVISVTNRATNTTTQGCGAPVGTGMCWDFTPCTPCAQSCPVTCHQCLTLAEGGTRCSGPSVSCTNTRCTTNADCAGAGVGAVCVISATDRATNTTSQGCGAAVGAGTCWHVTFCSIG